jgi:tRNA G18 (ribose-2'-O)-methylase SpoU
MAVGMSADLAERIVEIEAMSDARVADYQNVRDADLIGRRGVFLVEGEVTVRVLCRRSRFAVRSLLLAESRVASMADVIAALPGEVPVYVASQGVLDAVVGFSFHRGVLAAGSQGPPCSPADALAEAAAATTATATATATATGREPPSLVLGLEGLANHDNVGGIFRNAAALGAGAVLLDQATCDPLYRKAIRVSAGASLFVPFGRAPSTDALLAALRAAGYAIWALTPSQGAVDIDALLAGRVVPPRVALLLGAEGPGLGAAALAGADERVCIQMEPGFDSLNVATTSGIALHALRYAQRACAGVRVG